MITLYRNVYEWKVGKCKHIHQGCNVEDIEVARTMAKEDRDYSHTIIMHTDDEGRVKKFDTVSLN